MTAETRQCKACRKPFIGISEGLCPVCEKDEAFHRATRKRVDIRRFLPYEELLTEFRKLRSELKSWQKVALQSFRDRADREKAERHLSLALAVLTASGDDLGAAGSLALQLQKAKQELEITRGELCRTLTQRDRLQKEVERLQADRPDPIEEQLRHLRGMHSKPSIPVEMWRRLVQLAHPDRHGGSPAANVATQWLLQVRP